MRAPPIGSREQCLAELRQRSLDGFKQGVESWASPDTQNLLFDLSADYFSQRVLCHQAYVESWAFSAASAASRTPFRVWLECSMRNRITLLLVTASESLFAFEGTSR